MTDPNAHAITVTATATPATCPHPAEARTTRTDHGSFDWVYEVCGQCASERLTCQDDDDCGICTEGGKWMPVLDPSRVPAEHLEAAGLTGAPGVQVDAYLEGRYDAWREAETDAGAAGDAEPSAPSCPNCGGLVCAECASLYGRTAIHVYTGRCANGHVVPEVAAL